MEIALGLISALCWGMTDFLGGPAARRVGVRHAVFTTNAVGLVVVLGVLICVESARRPFFAMHWSGFAAAFAAALLLLCATLSLSSALKFGKAALVAPIAMSYGIVTTILSMLGGEHVQGSQLAGIAICMVGVPLTGMATANRDTDGKHGSTRHAPLMPVLLAIGAMVCFGTSYWIQGRFAIESIGSAGSLFVNYAFATCALGICLVCFKDSDPKPPAMRYPIVFAQAGFSLLALAAFSWGLTIGHTSTLAVLSTLSGAVTALLGFAFRGERLNPIQWAGVTIVMAGAAVVRW